MPSDEDIALSEKRLYGDRREETILWVGSATGLTRVEVSGDRVGRFELAESAAVVDLAATHKRLLVATPDDVLVGTRSGFERAGFGPAVAVGIGDDGMPVAGTADGRVHRLMGEEWHEVGHCEGAIAAIDPPLVAAGDGVYHLGVGLDHVGLDSVRDVAAAGPYAATSEGLYERTEEWVNRLEGDVTVVGADADRAHAVRDRLLARRNGDWDVCDLGVDAPVVDVAYGECPYAVTANGHLLVEATDEVAADGAGGWRSRRLGASDVTSLART